MKMCFSNEPEGKEKMGKVIAMTWINAWKAFIDSNKNKESPGPINNLDILTGTSKKCNALITFEQVFFLTFQAIS